MRRVIYNPKNCVECKVEEARYAGNNLCENCYKEFLKEKVEKY